MDAPTGAVPKWIADNAHDYALDVVREFERLDGEGYDLEAGLDSTRILLQKLMVEAYGRGRRERLEEESGV